jgi:hypothetical protein
MTTLKHFLCRLLGHRNDIFGDIPNEQRREDKT